MTTKKDFNEYAIEVVKNLEKHRDIIIEYQKKYFTDDDFNGSSIVSSINGAIGLIKYSFESAFKELEVSDEKDIQGA